MGMLEDRLPQFEIKGIVKYTPYLEPFGNWSVTSITRSIITASHPYQIAQMLAIVPDDVSSTSIGFNSINLPDLASFPWKRLKEKNILYFKNQLVHKIQDKPLVEDYYNITEQDGLTQATALTIKEHYQKLKNVVYYPHFEVHPTNADKTPATIMEGDYVSISFHLSSYTWKKDGQTLYGVNLEMDSVTKLQTPSIATPPKTPLVGHPTKKRKIQNFKIKTTI